MFGSKKPERVQIDPATGEITSGPWRGRSIGDRLGRHQRGMPSTVRGEGIIYDSRYWQIFEDLYNFNPPTDADGNRIRPVHPVAIGWLVPKAAERPRT